MGVLFEQVKGCFAELGWPFHEVTGQDILTIPYEGDGGPGVLVATVGEEHRILTVFARAPFDCPPERRGSLGEFITRANYAMTHGGFDLDLDDGEIRFKTGSDLANLPFEAASLQARAGYAVASMDFYLPALRAVVEGSDPRQSLEALFS